MHEGFSPYDFSVAVGVLRFTCECLEADGRNFHSVFPPHSRVSRPPSTTTTIITGAAATPAAAAAAAAPVAGAAAATAEGAGGMPGP